MNSVRHSARGNLYVTITVVVPKKLNSKQKEFQTELNKKDNELKSKENELKNMGEYKKVLMELKKKNIINDSMLKAMNFNIIL